MSEYSPDELMDARDRQVLAELGRVVDQVDPVPDGLADRSLFALTLAALQAEMVELVRLETREPALRGDATVQARTITFTAEPCQPVETVSCAHGLRARVERSPRRA